MSPGQKRRIILWILLPACLLVLAGLPFLSPPGLNPGRLLEASFDQSPDGQIFWKIRLPRILLGFLAGAALAVSGMVFQSIFRNPLATPFTLGVSSGASLGAALAVKLGLTFTLLGLSAETFCCFFGALLTVALVYLLSSWRRDFSTEIMLLSGVAISFCFSAAILFIQYISDFTASYQIIRWLMGDLNTVGYADPARLLAVLLPVLAAVLFFGPDLNLILAGDELAHSRGVNVRRSKIILFVCISLLIGTVVSLCGPIGFVGMMVPHVLRLLTGAEHRKLTVACTLAGGAFLAICDFAARTIIAPAEIPAGILTSMLGGPFFLWLLLRRRSPGAFPG